MSYRSSSQAFDEFMGSTVWDDMVQEMQIWLDGLHLELENQGGETPDRVLHRIGGNAQAIRVFMKMPEVIRDNIIDDRKETSEE